MPSWILMLLVACNGGDGGKSESANDSGNTTDTGGGGGSVDNWLPAGTGYAWFVDGTTDNSVLHLEMVQVRAPRDGEAYYGWVSKAGADPLPVGEIAVSGEELVFEGEMGTDAVLEGYDTFEAYATDNGGTSPDGTLLWAGAVDPTIFGVVRELLVESSATPDGLGSLRSRGW